MGFDPTTKAAAKPRSATKDEKEQAAKFAAEQASPPEPPAAVEIAASEPPAADPPPAEPPAPSTVLIEIPTHKTIAPYAGPFVEVGALRTRQAAALNFMLGSLNAVNARCMKGRINAPGGSVVETRADVIRWLLDRVADGIEEQTGKDLTKDFGLQFA